MHEQNIIYQNIILTYSLESLCSIVGSVSSNVVVRSSSLTISNSATELSRSAILGCISGMVGTESLDLLDFLRFKSPVMELFPGKKIKINNLLKLS